MATIKQINEQVWAEWVASRPPVVQAMCKSHPPDRLYQMASTGHKVTLYSYSENGTVTVDVTGQYNALLLERRVFGVDINDLTECDLPADDELLGAMLQTEDDYDETN